MSDSPLLHLVPGTNNRDRIADLPRAVSTPSYEVGALIWDFAPDRDEFQVGADNAPSRCRGNPHKQASGASMRSQGVGTYLVGLQAW